MLGQKNYICADGKHVTPSVHGVCMADLKFTSEKTVRLKNMQHALTINNIIVSGSLLCTGGYELFFESNNV